MDTAVLAVRTILSLAVVLGLIWYAGRRLNDSTSGRGGDSMLAGWVRRAGGIVGRPARGGHRAARRARPEPVVSVVGRQAIGPKASVAVVDVGGQRLVLGVSDAGVTVLTTMDAPVEVEAPVEAPAAAPVAAPAVAAIQPVTTTPQPDLAAIQPVSATPQPDFATILAAATTEPEVSRKAAREQAPAKTGPLAGSVLSPSTWRQTLAALRPGTPS